MYFLCFVCLFFVLITTKLTPYFTFILFLFSSDQTKSQQADIIEAELPVWLKTVTKMWLLCNVFIVLFII